MKTFAKVPQHFHFAISVVALFTLAACGSPGPLTPAPTATFIATETPSSTPAASNIVAIGDSNTWGGTSWTLLGHENTIKGGWVARLQIRLDEDFPGEFRLINKGSDGDTASGVLSRLFSLNQYQPTIVLVGIGTNDIIGITTLEQYQVRMEEIVNEIHLELPGAKVYLVGFTAPVLKYAEMIYPFFRTLDGQDSLDLKAEMFNAVLKNLAEDPGVFYINVSAEWPVDVEERWGLLADGLHPNDAGYDKITEIVYRALVNNLGNASNR